VRISASPAQTAQNAGLKAELFFPEVGVLDAERFGVECVFFDARFALCFVVLERFDRGAAHEEENQDADNVQPRHQTDANVTQTPCEVSISNRAVEDSTQ